jgi:hypothetical protein
VKIAWPRDLSIVMSTSGFREAYANSVDVRLADHVVVKRGVASWPCSIENHRLGRPPCRAFAMLAALRRGLSDH